MRLHGFFSKRRVIVTGHTGFKGAWLCEWLVSMGAEVTGIALDPPTSPSLFDALAIGPRLAGDVRLDIRDRVGLARVVAETAPEVVFHLAAQPLVRASYAEPAETFETNVTGTVNLLEALRTAGRACAVVCITTDKCYENREWLGAYRETDRLGGRDPYSASKAAAELVIDSYRRSFFERSPVRVASARAGNVVGGGDWAVDRVVPDGVRAWSRGEPLRVRNPHATRPWQHVLEPLGGYLTLAHALAISDDPAHCGAFNFGPTVTSNRSVGELVTRLMGELGGTWVSEAEPGAHHEASRLNLAIEKAFHVLAWRPLWDLDRTLRETADWYRAWAGGASVPKLTLAQIRAYEADAASAALPGYRAEPAGAT